MRRLARQTSHEGDAVADPVEESTFIIGSRAAARQERRALQAPLDAGAREGGFRLQLKEIESTKEQAAERKSDFLSSLDHPDRDNSNAKDLAFACELQGPSPSAQDDKPLVVEHVKRGQSP